MSERRNDADRPASAADKDVVAPHVARLRDSLEEELRAHVALWVLDVDVQTIRNIACSVAIQLDYAYEFTWSPRWEGNRR